MGCEADAKLHSENATGQAWDDNHASQLINTFNPTSTEHFNL